MDYLLSDPNYSVLQNTLRAWRNDAALTASPLAALRLVEEGRRNQSNTADALRHVLLDAVRDLQPESGPADWTCDAWQPYLIFHALVVEGWSHTRLAAQMSVSKSEYYRLRRKALAKLAEALAARERDAQQRARRGLRTRVAAGFPAVLPMREADCFVGRDAMCSRIASDILEGLERRRTIRIALYGLPGVGKSSLAAELAADLQIQDAASAVIWLNAGTGYERYLKARVTSFSNTVNALPVAASGYKIKVQSGRPVTLEHLEHVETGMHEIQAALTAIGVTCDLPALAAHVGLTIAHTDGKHPFLKRASGLYVVGERTISTGTVIGGRLLRSLAHEFAHMLDYEAGRATHGHEKALTDGLAMTRNEPIAMVLRNAHHLLNNGSEADILFKKLAGQLAATDEDRTRLRWNRARLGAYWHRNVEIWARMVEQRFALAMPSVKVAYDPDYSAQMAYWPDERVLEWAPVIDATLARMVEVILSNGRTQAEP
jgi:hypothetical protein